MLALVPVTRDQALEFIRRLHRHASRCSSSPTSHTARYPVTSRRNASTNAPPSAATTPASNRRDANVTRYTKTVTATQWTGNNTDELTDLMGFNFDPHGVGQNEDDPEALASFRDDHRGGSWRPLNVGDWVLRDDAGDWHTCPNDRFVATYKPEQ